MGRGQEGGGSLACPWVSPAATAAVTVRAAQGTSLACWRPCCRPSQALWRPGVPVLVGVWQLAVAPAGVA
jgi:hypothetical protein